MSVAAEQALRAEREQLAGHWQQRLERARYEGERAARQSAAVEPENRLVARVLEQRWEEALRHEQREQEAYARFAQECPAELTPRQRDAIRRLSHDVPGLWYAPPTTAKDRQEIVRLLLERITVDVQGDSEEVHVTLQWAGGLRSAHALIRPVGRYAQLATYPALLSRLDTLRGAGRSCAQIAVQLNRDGFSPPKRTRRFTGGIVSRLLSRHGLHGRRPPSMVEASILRAHEYWLTDLARRLAMPFATLYKWQRSGWVHSRKVEVCGGRWAIWADDDELERLGQLRAHQRKWPEPRYPATLTTPKRRDDEPRPCRTSGTTVWQG